MNAAITRNRLDHRADVAALEGKIAAPVVGGVDAGVVVRRGEGAERGGAARQARVAELEL